MQNGYTIKKQIADGTRNFEVVINDARAIDSAKFLPIRLSSFPKSLGLNADVKKGMFPYRFDFSENWNYIGKWPDLKFYEPDFKSETDRSELLKWHETVKD